MLSALRGIVQAKALPQFCSPVSQRRSRFAHGPAATLTAQLPLGDYRLYVFLRDGSWEANANIPFRVRAALRRVPRWCCSGLPCQWGVWDFVLLADRVA